MKKLVLKSAGSLLLIIAMVLSMSVSTFALTFRDTEDHWAERYIQKWADAEVVNGYSDGNYRPDTNIKRGEAAAIICRFLKLDTETDISNPFTDVGNDKWYYKNIMACYEAGVMIGNTDGTFAPENYISRQEAITTIGRAVNLRIGDSGIEQFTDGGNVAIYAAGYVNAMIRDGYVNGYSDRTIRPTNSISRAEFVKILYFVNAPLSETDPDGTYKLYVKIEDTLDKSVTASSSGYLTVNDLVSYEFVALIDSKYEDFRAAFPSAAAKAILDAGLVAFDAGDSAWADYVKENYSDVDEDYFGMSFVDDIISNRNAKLGELIAGIEYKMTFEDTQVGREDVVYTVTVWLERS